MNVVHIGFIKVYEFQGWKFEYDRNKPISPWPLKNDFEPRKSAGRKFYKIPDFLKLSIEEQEKYRVF